MGIPQDNFKRISALPLRKEFRDIRGTSKAEMKIRLEFDPNKPLIFVDFGSGGSEESIEIAKHLSEMRVVFICARNEKVKSELEKMGNKNHIVLGYVDKAQYMRAADVIIGKTGGLTTFEALECETPIIILTRDIEPGEKANLELLLQNHCAKLLNVNSELPYVIEQILRDLKYREGPQKFVNSAANEIAEAVKPFIENYDESRERLWEQQRLNAGEV